MALKERKTYIKSHLNKIEVDLIFEQISVGDMESQGGGGFTCRIAESKGHFDFKIP